METRRLNWNRIRGRKVVFLASIFTYGWIYFPIIRRRERFSERFSSYDVLENTVSIYFDGSSNLISAFPSPRLIGNRNSHPPFLVVATSPHGYRCRGTTHPWDDWWRHNCCLRRCFVGISIRSFAMTIASRHVPSVLLRENEGPTSRVDLGSQAERIFRYVDIPFTSWPSRTQKLFPQKVGTVKTFLSLTVKTSLVKFIS